MNDAKDMAQNRKSHLNQALRAISIASGTQFYSHGRRVSVELEVPLDSHEFSPYKLMWRGKTGSFSAYKKGHL